MAPKTQTTTPHPHSPVSASRRTRVASLALHQRKCIICHHPDREEIEEMFLHWFSPATIYRRFLLRDRYSIYRHAHATGLYQRRRRNLRCALENIIERSDECPISSNGIVRAIKAYASLTDAGEWIEPPSRVIYTNASATPAPAPNAIASHATGPLTNAPQATTSTIPADAQSSPPPTATPASQFTTTDRSAGVPPALFASVYPDEGRDAGPNAGTASHAQVPGTTVDGWNCRYGDVRRTVTSSAHATAISAPFGPIPQPAYPASDSVGPDLSRAQAKEQEKQENVRSYRAEGVHSTPPPSAAPFADPVARTTSQPGTAKAPFHTTATDAPVTPRKESTQTTAPAPLPSNRNTARIKFPLTNSKQRSDANSNRNK